MNISIILAAGEGTRMKSKTSKVLHKVCNKRILDYVVAASEGADIDKNIIVVGENKDAVTEMYKDKGLYFREQKIGEGIPYGTGYALIQCIDLIEDDSNVLILYGDTPLIRKETIEKLFKYHKDNHLDGTVLTAIVDEPFGYGRIIRDKQGNLEKILEEKDADENQKQIKEVNSGIYIFRGELLKEALGKIDNNNAQNEYYLTDVIKVLRDEKQRLGVYVIEDPEEILGVNSRYQLSICEEIMRRRINHRHMDNGVTLINPDNTYIDPDVIIGQDTTIYPGVHLKGQTEIGDSCILKGDTFIEDGIIGEKVKISSSYIEKSSVEAYTIIGPYAQIRPGSKIGSNCRIGNFVEIKNSTLGDNTKSAHLTYIGDSDLGKDINVGCGVVFVNYDGKNKHRSEIEDKAFIGCNVNIISPVKIGKGAFIAAGTTVVEDVEEGALSIARARQTNKADWAKDKGF